MASVWNLKKHSVGAVFGESYHVLTEHRKILTIFRIRLSLLASYLHLTLVRSLPRPVLTISGVFVNSMAER